MTPALELNERSAPCAIGWGVISIAVTLLAFSPPAVAESGLSVPPQQMFSVLVDALETPVEQPYWRCAPRRDQRCGCVEFAVGDAKVVLEGVELGAQKLRAERAVVEFLSHRFAVEQLEAGIDGDALTVTGGPWYFSSEEKSDILRADTGDFRVADEISGRFTEPVWAIGTVGESVGCDGDAYQAPGFEEETRLGSATALSLGDNGWRIEQLRTDGLLSLPVAESAGADRVPSGWLPPSVYAFSGGARLLGAYYFGKIPVSLRAHVDSRVAGGLGTGVRSSAATCTHNRCPKETLAVDAFVDRQGPAAIRLAGRGSIGDERVHASLDADGVGFQTGEYETDLSERLERGALFRDWRSQRIGLSASGAHHELAVGAAVASGEASMTHFGGGQERFSDLWARYGTRIELPANLRSTFDVHHRELLATDFDSARFSEVAVGLERRFGSLRRVFVRPAVRGRTAMGIVSEGDGMVAGSRMRLDAIVDGGVALRGRFAGREHLVSPRAFVGRRFEPVDAVPRGADVTPRPTGAVAGGSHFLAGAGIDQTLMLTESLRIRLPTSATVVDDGTARHWTPRIRTGLEVHGAARGLRLLGVEGVCTGLCSSGGLRANAVLRWARSVESFHIVGWGPTRLVGDAGPYRRMRTGYSGQLGVFFDTDGADRRWIYGSGVRVRVADWSSRIGLFGDLTDPLRSAAELTVGPHWRVVGWGVAMKAAARPHDGRWAAMIGIKSSPAF